MTGVDASVLQSIAVQALPLIFAITVHEVAHGWVAGKLGDPTARMMGRLTLNPVAHIDPVGTVLLPLLQVVFQTGTLFGWARPVPVNFANLRRPRRDAVLVAFAGPGSNFVQFVIWSLVILAVRFTVGIPSDGAFAAGGPAATLGVPLVLMALAGLQWNFWLGVLNLMPIVPLDGGRILNALLPPAAAAQYARLEPYGIVILVGVMYLAGPYLGFLLAPLRLVMTLLLG